MMRKLSQKVNRTVAQKEDEQELSTVRKPVEKTASTNQTREESLARRYVQRSQTMRETGEKQKKKVQTPSRVVSSLCGVCYKMYTDPKQLPCQHVFCCHCLQLYVNPKQLLDCPTCRQVVNVTIGGLSSLPDYNGDVGDEMSRKISGVGLNQKRSTCYTCSQHSAPVQHCLHCSQSFCDNCLEAHINQLEEHIRSARAQIQDNLDTLTQASELYKDNLSDLAVEADEIVEKKISDIQKRRAKLDEEMCDLLNQQVSEVDRLRNKVVDLTNRIDNSADSLGSMKTDRKMTLLKDINIDFDRLTKEIDGLIGEELQLDSESLCLTSLNPLEKQKAQTTSKTITLNKVGLQDMVKITWQGCVQPLGVGECPWNSQVFVCASGSGEVGVFSQEGKFLQAIRHEAMLYPCSVVFNIATRETFIADQRQGCVWVLDDTNQVVRSFGKSSNKKTSMSSPSKLVLDPKGRLAVVNHIDKRIQLWSLSGELMRHLGAGEDGLAGITLPVSLAFTHNGKRLGVLDSQTNRVHVFSAVSWRPLYLSGDGGERPVGFLFDSSGNSVILLKEKVQVFNGKDLVKTFPIAEGSVAINHLGDDIGICYTHHVTIKSWKLKK